MKKAENGSSTAPSNKRVVVTRCLQLVDILLIEKKVRLDFA